MKWLLVSVEWRHLEDNFALDPAARSSEDLLSECLDSRNETAWTEFMRRFHPLIASVVVRISRHWDECTPQAIDDLIQEVYLKLCASGLRSFKCMNPGKPDAIYGYIKTFTANLVQDRFKTSRAAKRGGTTGTISIDGEGPETLRAHEKRPEAALERKLLLEEVAATLTTSTSGANADRDRRIFWLYYRVGLPASAIAKLPTVNLNTKGVESTILRLTRVLREQLGSKQAEKQKNMGSHKGIGTENSF